MWISTVLMLLRCGAHIWGCRAVHVVVVVLRSMITSAVVLTLVSSLMESVEGCFPQYSTFIVIYDQYNKQSVLIFNNTSTQ